MSKVYALYFNENNHEMKISCEKHWENQRELLKGQPTMVVKYNHCIMISHSRATLVALGDEMKEIWLKNQYKTITKIARINLK